MYSILLVDDDRLFRETLADALSERGYAVSQAEDGEQGMKRFRASPTDLVITDIVMPNKDGTSSVAELRRDFPKVGIIAMSGGLERNPSLYLKIARVFGANRTLLKPFTPAALLQAVEEVLADCCKDKPDSPV